MFKAEDYRVAPVSDTYALMIAGLKEAYTALECNCGDGGCEGTCSRGIVGIALEAAGEDC